MFNFLKPPAGGAALAAPATLSGKRPRKEVEASEVPTLDMETLTQIVVMLTKYSLQPRQITDRLAATTFVSMTMNKSSKLIVAIKEAVDRYNTMQASHSPDQREAHGPPSIHLIGVILAHACSSVKEDNKFQMDCKEDPEVHRRVQSGHSRPIACHDGAQLPSHLRTSSLQQGIEKARDGSRARAQITCDFIGHPPPSLRARIQTPSGDRAEGSPHSPIAGFPRQPCALRPARVSDRHDHRTKARIWDDPNVVKSITQITMEYTRSNFTLLNLSKEDHPHVPDHKRETHCLDGLDEQTQKGALCHEHRPLPCNDHDRQEIDRATREHDPQAFQASSNIVNSQHNVLSFETAYSGSRGSSSSTSKQTVKHSTALHNDHISKGMLGMQLPELKELCAKYHLPKSGSKAELVIRIRKHLGLKNR